MARIRRKGTMKATSELVPAVYPDREQLRTARVFGWWSRAVPERVVRHARPVRLYRGVLTVHVTSAAWSQELQYLKEQLLAAVRRAAPEANVRDIRFRVGPLPEKPPRPTSRPPKEHQPPEPVTALPEELGQRLARIADDDLREAIADAAAVSLGRARGKTPK